ncbi:hypothetical protein [Vibrio rumoiensis]|uniref:hypothetical protein n=1 Tax=Vibrio rumoiensis TaxID=76258 RepID=UPI000B5C4FAA|nr:hypothetical protein [Vibrio rumoiensis]
MQTHDTDQLFLQIRTAHRLLAAYYQRLLPTIEQIAKGLELDYCLWQPKDFARPGHRSTNQFDRWHWDLLPALSTYYVFGHFEHSNKVIVGEYLVDFLVNSDTGVTKTNSHGEPDALSLMTSVENAESTLTINVYAPYQAMTGNWANGVWDGCAKANISESPNPQLDSKKAVVSNGFTIPLTDLFNDNAVECLIERTQTFIGAAVDKAKSLVEENQQENS